MTLFITILLSLLGVYFGIGLVFGVIFILKGLQAVDPDATEAGWGLRLLLLPGSIAFWVILWRKWSAHSKKS